MIGTVIANARPLQTEAAAPGVRIRKDARALFEQPPDPLALGAAAVPVAVPNPTLTIAMTAIAGNPPNSPRHD